MLTMNTKQQLNVLAIVASIAMIAYISGLGTVQAHTPNFMPYGEVGQEDELYFSHHGLIYINAVPSQGNGQFMAITDIDSDYSIDQAIDRFGIDEDVSSFVVEPSLYSNVGLVFELNDNLQFQLLGAIEA